MHVCVCVCVCAIAVPDDTLSEVSIPDELLSSGQEQVDHDDNVFVPSTPTDCPTNSSSLTPVTPSSNSGTPASISSSSQVSLSTSPIESSCTPQSGSTSGTSIVNSRSSPISEFLVLPTPVKKTKPRPASKCARVLTSVELRALLENKEKQKRGGRRESKKKERARRKKVGS